jgi:hypothetical protein
MASKSIELMGTSANSSSEISASWARRERSDDEDDEEDEAEEEEDEVGALLSPRNQNRENKQFR